MTWPVIAFWVLIAASIFRGGPLILYLFSGSVAFGGMSMLPPSMIGGANLPPQSACAVVLIFAILRRPHCLLLVQSITFDMRKLGFLFLFWLYSLSTAALLPRLFAGSVLLYPLNNTTGALQFLQPSSGNVTQMGYLTISIAIAVCFAVAGRDPVFRRQFAHSVICAATLLVVTGVVELAFTSAGLASLLAPFHNAGYSLLADADVGGQKRVIGLMPEASAYGGACCVAVAFLTFYYGFFEYDLRRMVVAPLIAATIIMIMFSTSTTGYVGLLAIAVLLLGQALSRMVLAPRASARKMSSAVGGVVATMLASTITLLLYPLLFSDWGSFIDLVLFQKANSSSYVERHSWTTAGVDAFWSTYGLGVGIGSIRTSNWYANILASTGVVGSLLIGCFLIRLVVDYFNSDHALRPLQGALMLAIIPGAIMIGLADTTPDPGVSLMALLGLIVSARPQAARQIAKVA